MRYELTVADLVEAVQEHLDVDHRFAHDDEGYFPWCDEKVAYVRLPDEYQLTYRGEVFNVVRL
jgi:hypothetical protein